LWKFEVTRLIARRRWLILLPAFALVGYIGVDSSWKYGSSVNLWDGLLASFYNSWSMRSLVLIPFIFLVGDTFLIDQSSNYIWLAHNRAVSRARWWTAKCLAVLFASLVYMVAGVTVVMSVVIWRMSTITSVFKGSIWSTQFSPFALGVKSPGVYGRFYEVFWPTTPFGFVPVFTTFTALALGALALMVIIPTLWWPRTFVPLGATMALIALSHALSGFRQAAPWNPVWRMMYGWHFHHDLAHWGYLLVGSAFFFLVVAGIAIWGGARRSGRLDL